MQLVLRQQYARRQSRAGSRAQAVERRQSRTYHVQAVARVLRTGSRAYAAHMPRSCRAYFAFGVFAMVTL